MNETMGLLLGLRIGAACRWFDIPAPAPPRITGTLLVVAMTPGFVQLHIAPVGARSAGKGSSQCFK